VKQTIALCVLWLGCSNTPGGPTTPEDGGPRDATRSDAGLPVVLPCDSLDEGHWENVTPPGVTFAQIVAVDPRNPGTVYLGAAGDGALGIWRSIDCGATWIKTNTGRHAHEIDAPGHWTFVVDPVDSQILYTNNGYAADGVWKSTNGGTDWQQLEGSVGAFVSGGFVERIAMDPTDHLHLTVTAHFSCVEPHTPNCMLETHDGGEHWSVLENQPESGEDSGQFMADSSTWFMSTWGTYGLKRTTNAGASWDTVAGYGTTDSVYMSSSGAWYVSSLADGILRSNDRGATWEALAGSPHVRAVTGDGTRLFASDRNSGDPRNPYFIAREDAPDAWSSLGDARVARGGWILAHDGSHGILYSATETDGLWRVRTPN
jgi:hypothetical protein